MMRLKIDRADEIEQKVFDIVNSHSKDTVYFEVNPQNLS